MTDEKKKRETDWGPVADPAAGYAPAALAAGGGAARKELEDAREALAKAQARFDAARKAWAAIEARKAGA